MYKFCPKLKQEVSCGRKRFPFHVKVCEDSNEISKSITTVQNLYNTKVL